MSLEIRIGLNAIESYRRLAYTAWHAIAEFVDNSTQSYFNNREALDEAFKKEGEGLHVAIVYDAKQNGGFLRIHDNAMGMNYEELEYALYVARPPQNKTGSCRYGMGMKTAACWIGNYWRIRTKKLGSTQEHTVQVDVRKISFGNPVLPTETKENLATDQHYTIIEIMDHNRPFHGRTLGKIRDHLRSMYREDFRSGVLTLEWQMQKLEWEGLDDRLLKDREHNLYKRDFVFEVNGKSVHGWAGILDRGGRADAGFSILHCNRVVKGWPDSWRPERIFGQARNDLINQRLVGEVHLDDFDVSHTKDDIQWFGGEEEEVEEKLLAQIRDYVAVARTPRKRQVDERGPSEGEIDAAVSELRDELTSQEMIDQIEITVVPPEEAINASLRKISEPMKAREPTFKAVLGTLQVSVFVVADMSPSDPYVVLDTASADRSSLL